MSTITDPALKENNAAVERYTAAWQVVPKGDAFNDLCLSVIYIVRMFHQRYRLRENIDDNCLKTNYKSSKKILELAINLLCNGQSDEVYSFALNMEFYRAISQNFPLSDLELGELILARDFMHYIRIDDKDKIYNLISYVCDKSNQFMPSEKWYEMPL